MQSEGQRRKTQKYDYLVKVIIIGDSGVGKTNLITRFCQNQFRQTYVATIGVDFKIKSLFIDEKKFKMQIWDTAGQERFKNITQTYYKGSAGIVMTYSIIDPSSLENIQRWIAQIQLNAPKNASKILVATKSDLTNQRVVSQQAGRKLAQKYDIPYLQVSAKNGTNVKQAFQALLRQIKTKFDRDGEVTGLIEQNQTCRGQRLQINNHNPNKNCSC